MDYIYGIRPVEEALDSGKHLDKIFIQKGLQGPQFRNLFQRIRGQGIPYQFVPLQRLQRITRKNHQGIIAYLSVVEYQLVERLLPMLYEQGRSPFLLVVDSVTDVRNLGAIARTAYAAGCDALVLPQKNSASVNADAVKTSAGALMHLPVCRELDLSASMSYMKDSGLAVVAATEKGEDLYQCPLPDGPVALVLGSEEKGIQRGLLELADYRVRIPMSGEVSSLNVSVAAGILLYEVVRIRRRAS